MSVKSKVIFSTVLASLGLTVGASDASAARFELLPNFDDQDFDALIDDGTFVEDYRAESRIGADGSRDYELALIEGPSTQPTVQKQFSWGNGDTYDFSLTSDGSTVTYTVVDTILTSNSLVDSSGINTVYIRALANLADTSVELNNIQVDQENFQETISADGNGDQIEYLKITDIDSDFTLTGTSSFAWTGDKPLRSNLAYQFKVGTQTPEGPNPAPTPVPEPASISLFSLGLLSLAFGYRKRQ